MKYYQILLKKVLITGGTGLIGREIAKILSDAGSDVTVVSLDNIKISDSVKAYSWRPNRF